MRYNNYLQFTNGSRNNFNNLLPPGSIGPYVPTADFETGLFSIFTAGNFGSDIAFWVDDDISVAGANANGGLGEAYLKFVNVGRFLKLPEYAMNLRVGQMELDIPFTQSKSIWISPYDIYAQANVGVVNPAFNQQFVNNSYTLAGFRPGHRVQRRTPHRRLQLLSCLHQPEHQRRWDRTRTRAVPTFRRRRAAITVAWASRRTPTSKTSTPALITASILRRTRKAATRFKLRDRAARAITPT